MKIKSKRLLSLLFTLCMVLSLLPGLTLTAHAAYDIDIRVATLTDVTEPVAGEKPITAADVKLAESNFTVKEVVWYPNNGGSLNAAFTDDDTPAGALTADATFEQDTYYVFRARLDPKSGYRFSPYNQATVKIGGEPADKIRNLPGGQSIYVYKLFPAGEILAGTEAELKALLEHPKAAQIKLTADIRYSRELSSEGLDFSPFVVNGYKEIDLNGYAIDISYEDYRWTHFATRPLSTVTLFEVKNGATLVMNDSSGGNGKVVSDGYIHDVNDLYWLSDYAGKHTGLCGPRNVFKVNNGGTLVVNEGQYMAGRSKDVYIAFGTKDNAFWSGNARVTVNGTAVIVDNGGTCYINGGELDAYSDIVSYRQVIRSSGTLVINGGTLQGRADADVFNTNISGKDTTINGGTFKTKELFAFKGTVGRAFGGADRPGVADQRGYLNLKAASLNPDASFIYNGKSRTYAEVTDGWDFSKSQETFKVIPYGPANIKIIGPTEIYKGERASFDTSLDRYFTDLGLEGMESKLWYLWTVVGPDGEVAEQDTQWDANGYDYFFDSNSDKTKAPGWYDLYVQVAESPTGKREDAVINKEIGIFRVELKAETKPAFAARNEAQDEYAFSYGETDDYGREQFYYLEPSIYNAAWSVEAGALPDGVRIVNGAAPRLVYDGIGAATTEPATVTLRVTMTDGENTASKDKEVVINIVGGPVINMGDKLPNAIIGEDYSVTLEGTSSGNKVWSASYLPEGLTVTGEWKIVGKVTNLLPQTYRVYLYLTDTQNGLGSGKWLDLTTLVRPDIKDLELYRTPGGYIEEQIDRNTDIDSWKVTSGALPAGIELTPDGRIYGTIAADANGTYTATVTATNGAGSDTATVRIMVADDPAITNSPFEYLFLTAVVGKPFEYQMTGDPSGCTWEIVADGEEGSRNADWLSIDEDGKLTGTPEETDYDYLGGDTYDKFSTSKAHYTYARINYSNEGVDARFQPYVTIRLYDASAEATDIDIDTDKIKAGVLVWENVKDNGKPAGKITLENGYNVAKNEVLPGLVLSPGIDPTTYILIGNPPVEAAGQTYSFTLRSTNDAGSYDETFTVTLPLARQMPMPTLSIPGGPIDGTTSVTLSAVKPETPLHVRIVYYINGTEHTELTGLDDGNDPTLEATFNVAPGDVVTARAEDAWGFDVRPSEVATWVFTNKAGGVDAPEIQTTSLPNGKVGTPYSAQVKGVNGTIKWSVEGLPAGLSIGMNNGLISGTPTADGTFSVKLTAQNAGGSTDTTLDLKVTAGVQITTGSLKEGAVGRLYEDKLEADPTGANWTLLTELPDGLTFTDSTGTISGTPEESDILFLTVRAESGSDVTSKALLLIIHDAPKIETESPLPKGGVNADYSVRLELEEDADGVEWTVPPGTLPAGLELNKDTGEISGKPTADGEFTFEVKAKNDYGEDIKEFKITILAKVVTKIEITTPPTKTAYTEGDTFNPAGAVVQAVWSNDDRTDITDDVKWYDGELMTGMTAVGASYIDTTRFDKDEEGASSHTARTPIMVKAKPSSGGDGGGSVVTSYTLTFNTGGGSAIAALSKTSGTVVDLAAYKPTKAGHTFAGWYEDSALTKAVTSVTLKANATVYGKWTEGGGTDAGLPFIDGHKGDWFYDNVAYVYHKGLMVGTSSNTFSPHMGTTRGMIVTILHRLEGTPAATANPFTDVADGKWYADAVAWAAENGVVSGFGNGKFGPDDNITREQMAAILYRYARYKGYDVTAKADLSKFTDADTVSGWAMDAMSWANAAGLVQGDGTNLMPTGNAERCQVAAILQRFIENIVK